MREERQPSEIVRDILLAMHLLRKAGERTSVSKVAHRTFMSNRRLNDWLVELRELGLVDGGLMVTKRGYDYLVDHQNHVEPFLRRYLLRGRRKREPLGRLP